MKWVFPTKVKKVEERTWVVRARKRPDGEIEVERASRGWFVVLEGSSEAIRFGDERPDLAEGEQVVLTIERY